MLTKKINKLFFNEYPFRIKTKSKGANLLIRQGFEKVVAFCASNNEKFHFTRFGLQGQQFTPNDKSRLLKYSESVLRWTCDAKDNGIKIYCALNTINLYFKDEDLYRKAIVDLKPWISELNEPGSQEELDYMYANGAKQILVDKLPHDGYEYRVFLKENLSANKRSSILDWINRCPDGAVKPSKSTVDYLAQSRYYNWNPFLYINNSQNLTLLGLVGSGTIRRVERFVLRSSVLEE